MKLKNILKLRILFVSFGLCVSAFLWAATDSTQSTAPLTSRQTPNTPVAISPDGSTQNASPALAVPPVPLVQNSTAAANSVQNSVSVGSNQISNIAYNALTPQKTQVIFTLKGPVKKLESFSTDAPSRIVLDFWGVQGGIDLNAADLNKGVINSVQASSAGGRTRVVLSLQGSASYDTKVMGSQVYLTITERTQPVYTQKTPRTFSGNTWSKSQHQIKAIDFHRNADGGGQVMISLSDASMGIDVNQQGQNVVVDFINTVAQSSVAQRKLDVTDFGTPVQTINITGRGGNTRLTVAVKGDYKQAAYQINKQFVIDIAPANIAGAKNNPSAEKQYTGDRLSLNFQNIPVRSVLEIIADFTGLNIVASDSVNGNITLRLNNIPWDEALDIIMKTQGLSELKMGKVLLIAPSAEIADRQKADLQAQQDVQQLEVLQTAFVTLNYAKADDVATILKDKSNSLLSERGAVTVDKRTNALLIQDTPETIDEVRGLIEKLDVPVKQVLIESRIVEVTSDFERTLGIRWGISKADHVTGTFNGASGMQQNLIDGNSIFDNANVRPTDRLNVNLPAAPVNGEQPGSVGVALANLGHGYLLDLELSALESEGQAEVISSPRLVTADQQQAFIEAGQEIPYEESSASGATTVAFQSATLKLDVTPHITPDNNIIMAIKVNQDRPDFTNPVKGTPTINTRKIDTKVLVGNGETIVLGGIYSEEKSKAVVRIPFLGEIPLFGALFRNTAVVDKKAELLIFITPKIVQQDTLA